MSSPPKVVNHRGDDVGEPFVPPERGAVDCSLRKDGSVMKQTVSGGDGESVRDTAWVTLELVSADRKSQGIKFRVGDGNVCDALEGLVLKMTKGEKGTVTCTKMTDLAWFEHQFPSMALIEKSEVKFTAEMTAVEQQVDEFSGLSEVKKIEVLEERKKVGGEMFKMDRFEVALARYEQVVKLAKESNCKKKENKAKIQELRLMCEMNASLCHLRLGDHVAAKRICDEVLKQNKNNVKALFRRSQALEAAGDKKSALKDLEQATALEPQNKDLQKSLERIRQGKPVPEPKPSSQGLSNLAKKSEQEKAKSEMAAAFDFASKCAAEASRPAAMDGEGSTPTDDLKSDFVIKANDAANKIQASPKSSSPRNEAKPDSPSQASTSPSSTGPARSTSPRSKSPKGNLPSPKSKTKAKAKDQKSAESEAEGKAAESEASVDQLTKLRERTRAGAINAAKTGTLEKVLKQVSPELPERETGSTVKKTAESTNGKKEDASAAKTNGKREEQPAFPEETPVYSCFKNLERSIKDRERARMATAMRQSGLTEEKISEVLQKLQEFD